MIYRLRLRFRIGSMGSFPPVYRPCVHWCWWIVLGFAGFPGTP